MTSPNTPDPVTLAKIAAQLNPQLTCDDPAKAIELARNLLLAADPELAKQEADRAEEMEVRSEGRRHDELFPRHELISVAEAFKALPPGHYKTETRFAALATSFSLIRCCALASANTVIASNASASASRTVSTRSVSFLILGRPSTEIWIELFRLIGLLTWEIRRPSGS
jgi:hypothetical protein